MENWYRRKLIEVALPLPEINDASAYDKMPGIGPHPKGIHQWWARLPLPTARAVLFASVVDDPSGHPEKWPTEAEQGVERERLFGIIRRMMTKKLHEHAEVYAEARAVMESYCSGKLPTHFDPFAGGGSIPLEAVRLGFEAYAQDLNPVAVLLNRCNLEYAPKWAGCAPVNPTDRGRIGGTDGWIGARGLAADVRYYGHLVSNQLREDLGRLYPKAELPREHGGGKAEVVAWIWARTVASPNPAARGRHVPLLSTQILSSKTATPAWVEIVPDEDAPDGWLPCVRSGVLGPAEAAKLKLGTKAGKGQDFFCVLTGHPIRRSYVQSEGKAGRLGIRLLAIVADGGRAKLYLSPSQAQETIGKVHDSRVEEARRSFLGGSLPTRAEITGGVCSAYGLATWGSLFHPRQLLALLALGDLISAGTANVVRDALAAGYPKEAATEYAKAVSTFLALAADRCADFNNCLCRWNSSNQKVMNLFARQALPMVFDSAEANTLGSSVGAWDTCYEYVSDCIEVLISSRTSAGHVRQLDAASGGSGLRGFLVSTDPPYYDNISYATLSDFFYVWLRRTLGNLDPELFSTVLTPKLQELIASPDRFGGSKEAAREHFETGFRRTFTELASQMDSRFPLTVFYAFKQADESTGDEDSEGQQGIDLTTGWETLLEALIGSGLQITATWPVRASQKWRLVSMGANALASYIVLACRPRPSGVPLATRREYITALREELPKAIHDLQHGNIAPVDLAQAAIGPGMAVFSRYAKVLESDGSVMPVRAALALVNQALDEILTEQEGEFDADTRWALAWFEEQGVDEGPFGMAETLSKAKNTAVNGLVEAGILQARSGKVRLLRRDELLKDWDPAQDRRFTVWEATQYMIRVLDRDGEEAAAALLKQLGGIGETARNLAYRLFAICERRKWAEEALPYNALVIAWPEIVRLSQAQAPRPQMQGDLFGNE